MSGKSRAYRLLLCACIITLFAMFFTACAFTKRKEKSVVQATPEIETSVMTGIVVQNNTDSAQLQVREMESDVINILSYGAASSITDKFGEARAGEEIEIGMILQVTYRMNDGWLVSAEVPKDVWEYRDVHRFTITSDEGMMLLAGQKYRYSGRTFFGSGNDTLEPMELHNQDVLTVRGIGIDVYSAVRTSGHGYIRLVNYQDFIGGMAEISKDMIVPVSENMLITVAEGTYRLTLYRRRTAATKTVTVRADEETVVDFSDYTVTARNVGEVVFEIEPDGAELYLNGTAVNYAKPIALSYGKYNVTVSLTGYKTYSGVLSVAQAMKTIRIDLVEETATAENSTASPTATPKADTDKQDSVTKKIDSNHTITVSAPEGAEVYLDNVYKGLAPCTFTKVIGSQTITLSMDGYVTKSYSVDILDDDKNAKFSFAELVKDDSKVESESSSDTAKKTEEE